MQHYSFHTRVSYDDIDDQMSLTLKGVMGLMQEAAILHSDQSGYSVFDTERTRVIWMLVQWHVKLVGKAMWNDLLTVRTWPRTMERLTSSREFEVVDQNGSVVAIGDSTWVLVSADTGRIVRITPEVAGVYHLDVRRVFEADAPVYSDNHGEPVYCGAVLRRDLDTNHHVNNRVYLDYARQALPEDLVDQHFSEVIVRYRKQLLYGQQFHCWYQKDGNAHVVYICGDDPKIVHGSVVFLV